MSKKSTLARKRAEQEAARRSRQRRLWGIGVGVAALVLLAALAVIVYLVFRSDSPPRLAQAGDTLTVNYTGWLEDGTKFDSSYDRGVPFKFTLGEGGVIEGWDQGLVGMQVGEKKTLTIPPELAYGKEGRPPSIPPNATLTFEVELVAIG